MKEKLSMILLSHLNDARIELTQFGYAETQERGYLRTEFVKFLILKYLGTGIEIDPDKEWDLFMNFKNQKS